MTDLNRFDLEDELDDFDSDDLVDVEDADDTYLDSMWSGRGFRRGATAELAADTVVAHGMVQSFVNAFARDGHYVVSFDANTQTAGTDMKAKHVVITPSPITDGDLTPEQAGKILTGLAVHEISHPRYGRRTYEAVQKVFPRNGVADRISNLLDDIRIERRFVADYPGYAGIFAPTLEYIGNASVKSNGGRLHKQTLDQPVNLAIAATRYPTFSSWDEATLAEAAWWNDWADRGSKEDAPKRHVEFIREALAHIASAKKAAPKKDNGSQAQPGPTGAQSNDGDATDEANDAQDPQGQGGSAGDANDTPEQDGAPDGPADDMSDADLNAATRDADANETEKLGSCSGSNAVDGAALQGDTNQDAIDELKEEAQNIVEAARNLEDDGHGNKVDVAKSMKGLASGGEKYGPSSLASRYIRNAILRSRTGHTEVDPFQKRGRLDQKGLQRSAFGDSRLFERRTAPSPGKYNVWVMVDCSGSMSMELPAAAQVAHAMAAATQGTPSVRLTVWGWSNPFRYGRSYYANAGVVKVWEPGQDTNQIFRMSGLQLGGTPDASVMSWAGRAIRKATAPDTTPVIIFISDGAGDNEMDLRVEEVRKMGVVVKSVSFGRSFTEDQQRARFGKGNFVPFAGSITATAKPLADLFVKITSR